ncbi:MAG: ThuA domain-containing protein [Planctomycetota bacterium]
MKSLLLFASLLFGSQEDIGGVPYVRGETRSATYEAMLAELLPTKAVWGDFHRLGAFPFAGHGKDDLRTPHSPEDELPRYAAGGPGPDLERTHIGKKGVELSWTNLGPMASRVVDLHASEDRELLDFVTGYLYTTIESPRAQRLEFPMGSDDGLRVWLNGKLIHELDRPRGLNPNADLVAFDLEEGTNHALFKIADGQGGWAFQVLTRKELEERDDALLHYYLDRDFPPAPDRAHYRALTIPLTKDQVLEVGGLDFLSDGRPVVCTRRGDVWLVDGAYDEPPADPRWTLFAEGLHEPLGVGVRSEGGRDAVYTVQRGELTRLVDTDGDDVADRYEAFCSDWGVSGNYHEFAFGPEFDRDGNAWVTLNVGFCGALGKATAPYRGWAAKVTPEGELVPVASGLRSPNGIGAWTDGAMFYVDNQGDYVATNRLSHLAEGSWHGHPASLRWREDLSADERPPRQPAAVWFPYRKMGQSAADVALCDVDGRFGPFDGQLFVGDQTRASVMRVSLELIDGHYQGACYPFIEALDCGVNRVAFGPDGSMFVGQTDRGWGSVGRRRFGLQRIVYGGETPFEIRAMRAAPDGFELELTQDVDPESAADAASYALKSYRYEYHAAYGAPEDDTQTLDVRAEVTGPRTVRLVVEPLRAGFVHELSADGLRNAAGAGLLHADAYYTLERIPGRAAAQEQERRKVLFLTHSAGFTHGVVKRPREDVYAHAEERFVEAAKELFEVTPTQDCGAITADNLARYDAVVFYTTGELPIDDENRAALMDWIRAGGAFGGVHCATDTWYQFAPYMDLIGGAFDGHPWHELVGVRVDDPHHPATRHLGERFEITDEIYQFRSQAFRELNGAPLRVLLSLDNDSVDASKGKYAWNPLSWTREWGEGRVFYTALGHRPDVWKDERFLTHLIEGVGWAIDGPDTEAPLPAGARPVLDAERTDGWRHKDGADFAWKAADGVVEVVPGTGDLVSEEAFGDQLLHVEFRVPEGANSGVYVHGRYEVQVLDSYGRSQEQLRQGDCGGLYGQHKPALNASRAPGRWQSFDIRFTAARFEAGQKTQDARITVWHNGLRIHDDVALSGPTAGGLAQDEVAAGPLLLQDHGNPVQYRNLWLQPLDDE